MNNFFLLTLFKLKATKNSKAGFAMKSSEGSPAVANTSVWCLVARKKKNSPRFYFIARKGNKYRGPVKYKSSQDSIFSEARKSYAEAAGHGRRGGARGCGPHH